MAESTPPFKLYFDGDSEDVQSFRCGREAGFERFKELLSGLYPRYDPEQHVLQYIGAGGQKTSFRNEDEYEAMLVKCRDSSLVKLYIEGRIDKSEITPVYYGWPYWGYYGPYGHPYWHDWHSWHWGGWGSNRRIYHALQNLWVGQHFSGPLPLWLSGAVRLVDDDYDVNVDAFLTAINDQTADCMKSRDPDVLRQAKNLLATHLMVEQGNVEVLFKLGKVDALLGNYSSAITWLKKAAAGGFNDSSRLEDKVFNCLHGQSGWSDIVSTVRHNKGPTKTFTKPSKSERVLFKPGKGPCEESDSSSKSSAPKAAAAPPKAKEEEKPAPKPAAGGFLFSLPGAQPEKPKEEPKPAPKATGFLFSLPGAAQPEPAKPEPVKEAPKPAEPPKDTKAPEAPPEVKKWGPQLDALHGMGFLDDSLLIGFLEKFKGNVDDVLNELLG